MLYLRRVVGHSMTPTLRPDTICVFVRARTYNDGDIVLARIADMDYVKRVREQGGTTELAGDNAHDSHTIRDISRQQIRGKLIYPHKN